MSTATEISRIETAKNTIQAKLIEWGMAQDTDKLDRLAAAVESIENQSKTVTPTREQQNVTPDSGYFGLSGVTVNAIPEDYQDVSAVTAGAGDVLKGKILVDARGKAVTGTMPDNGTLTKTIDGLTASSVTIPAGYTTGGTVSLTNDIETALAAI